MTTVTVTTGSALDVPDIMPVMDAAFDPAFGERWSASQCFGALSMPGTALLIAHAGASPVGFAIARTIAGECELMMIAVDPEHQHRGIGSALLNAVIAAAEAHAAEAIFLEVRQGNPALSLYAHAGFVKVGERPNYYHGSDGQSFSAETYRKVTEQKLDCTKPDADL